MHAVGTTDNTDIYNIFYSLFILMLNNYPIFIVCSYKEDSVRAMFF